VINYVCISLVLGSYLPNTPNARKIIQVNGDDGVMR